MKRIVLLYAALALAAAGYAGFWFYRAGQVEDIVDAGIAALEARGWEASHGGLRVSGFPYRLAAEFTRPALAAADGGWRWEGEAITIYAEPWNLRHLVGAAPRGRHVLRMSRGSEDVVHDIDMLGARGSVVFDRAWRPLRGVAEVSRARVSLRGGERVKAAKMLLSARRGEASAAAAIDLSFRIESMLLPKALQAAPGRLVALLAADTVLSRPPPGDLSAAELARWRDDSGALDIRALSVDWGPVSLRGTGRLSLDEALRPAGEIESRIAGFPELVETLRGQEVIGAATALALTLGVGLLEETPADGGPPEVSVPVTLGGGQLSIGPAPIVDLAPLTPDAPR